MAVSVTPQKQYHTHKKRCAAGQDCPYCAGRFIGAKLAKYCCEDSKLWHRRQLRAKAAARAGRQPGRVGRPAKPRQQRAGLVYIVFLGDCYKIGKAKHDRALQNRLTAYRTVRTTVDLVAVIETPDYTRLEKELHQQFADRRIERELFRLTDADVAYILSNSRALAMRA
ncbi:MAG: GIY-YIG nuclease family protein [Chloroflexi bacterium]|nr:GIY-YIG nuclease family protein [Chloroflexota bacterium]